MSVELDTWRIINNKWHHIAQVGDQTYLDGKLVETAGKPWFSGAIEDLPGVGECSCGECYGEERWRLRSHSSY